MEPFGKPPEAVFDPQWSCRSSDGKLEITWRYGRLHISDPYTGFSLSFQTAIVLRCPMNQRIRVTFPDGTIGQYFLNGKERLCHPFSTFSTKPEIRIPSFRTRNRSCIMAVVGLLFAGDIASDIESFSPSHNTQDTQEVFSPERPFRSFHWSCLEFDSSGRLTRFSMTSLFTELANFFSCDVSDFSVNFFEHSFSIFLRVPGLDDVLVFQMRYEYQGYDAVADFYDDTGSQFRAFFQMNHGKIERIDVRSMDFPSNLRF